MSEKDNNMSNMEEVFSTVGYELLKRAAISLPEDVVEALHQAYKKESTAAGRAQLKAILENIDVAKQHNLPICQDTGLPLFFIKWGLKFRAALDIRQPLAEAVEKATKDTPLRPNVINPLTKENPGINVGWGMPYIYYEVDPVADYVEITGVPKGFGCEAKSALVFIVTSESIPEAVMRCVLDHVVSADGEPCPPTIIGIGIGGTADIAMHLAKRATFRHPVGTSHENEEVARLERQILEAVNSTGIGPMAVGGDTTSLAVHAEICGAHTAIVSLGITFQCWAARYSTARIYPDGSVLYITHREGAK